MKKIILDIKGITLIALVVTIIVTIILAGVSLNLLLGNNGIIQRAKKQKEQQEILQITEKLELQKAAIAVENDNKVKLDDYLAYIYGEGKIDNELGEIERVDKDNAYIIVDGKYEYLLKQEENDNLLIIYQGKVDELLPRITSLELTSTTNEIKIKVSAKRAKTYIYSITNNMEYEEEQSNKTGEYTFTGLTQNEKYYLIIKAKNNNGEVQEKREIITNEVVESEGNIAFSISPNKWTNQKVIVNVSTQTEGFSLQTSKDAITWKNTTEQTFTENGTIYARLIDNEGQYNGTASREIAIIDKEMPEDAIISFNTDITDTLTAIQANITLEDKQSGVDIEQCKWVYTTTDTELGIEESNYLQTFTKETEEISLESNVEGTYYLHILTVDKAGNRKETISTTVTINKVEFQQNMSYTGTEQIFIAPYSGIYKIELYGAGGQGITCQGATRGGGYGTYVVGSIELNKEDEIYIYVGGKGAVNTAGYNGGGSGLLGSGGGGGATDVRIGGNSIENRVLVAGGGGGGPYYSARNEYDIETMEYGSELGSLGSLFYGGNGTKVTYGSQYFCSGGSGGGYYGGYSAAKIVSNLQETWQGNGSSYINTSYFFNYSNQTKTAITYSGTNGRADFVSSNITYKQNSGNGYAIITLQEVKE